MALPAVPGRERRRWTGALDRASASSLSSDFYDYNTGKEGENEEREKETGKRGDVEGRDRTGKGGGGVGGCCTRVLYVPSGPPSGRISRASQPAPAQIKLVDLARDERQPILRSKIAQSSVQESWSKESRRSFPDVWAVQRGRGTKITEKGNKATKFWFWEKKKVGCFQTPGG